MKTNQLKTNIPNGWKFHKLNDLLTFVVDNRGKTPPIQSSGIPMAEVNAIGDRNIKYSEITKFVSAETYKNWFRKHLEKNDILFSTVGRTASCSLYTGNTKTVIAQNLIGLRFGKDNPEFMFYLLTQDKNNQQFKNIEMSAAQPSVKVSQMIHLEFLVPPLPEQNRIVSVLETWDKSIENLSKKIQVKKQIKKGLMQNLLKGKKRIKGFDGEWRKVTLGSICDLYQPKTITSAEVKNTGKYKVYGANGIIGYYDKYNHENAEVIITCRGSTCGVINYSEPMSWITGNAMVASPKDSKTDKDYLFYILNFMNLRSVITGMAQPQITGKDLSPFKLEIPDIKEQNAISKILTTADKEITEFEQKLSILKEQKRYLLNNLITGTIRTPDTLSTKVTQ